MTGIAAAICLGFSSCSKFDFTPITHGEEVYESYETAFVNKFGEPAPEQTWGCGTSTSTRAALTRSILASYNFPSDASSDNFLSEVPEGVEKYSYGKPVCYVAWRCRTLDIPLPARSQKHHCGHLFLFRRQSG